jgi:hypothetical protein
VSSRILRVCALLTITACASHAPSQGAEAAQAVGSRNRDVITQDELSAPAMQSQNVLEVIRSLRPQFLTVRGLHTMPVKDAAGNQIVDEESGKVHVSIDGGKILPLDELSNITAARVVEIRFLNPSAAMQRFGGTAREGPVIVVKTM